KDSAGLTTFAYSAHTNTPRMVSAADGLIRSRTDVDGDALTVSVLKGIDPATSSRRSGGSWTSPASSPNTARAGGEAGQAAGLSRTSDRDASADAWGHLSQARRMASHV